MIYTVHITEQAENDLRGIYEYIAFGKKSPENAGNQIDRLEESINALINFPEKHRPYDKEPWFSRGTRVMPVDNYVVYYIPNETTGIINVIRVLYSGQDRDAHLSNTTVE